jgi:NitT/TauT family transport system ATP-binding protein
MQQLLLRIWEETAATVVFVTHDVDEAIFLADEILIMSARPGTIVEKLKIPFERPRSLDIKQTEKFHELQSLILQRLKAGPGRGQVRISV